MFPNKLILRIDVWKNLKSLLCHRRKENCSKRKKRKPKLTKVKLNLNKKIKTKTAIVLPQSPGKLRYC